MKLCPEAWKANQVGEISLNPDTCKLAAAAHTHTVKKQHNIYCLGSD